MEKKPKYLLDVVPLTRISLGKDPFFYYACEDKLPAGTLVEIQFLKRKLRGIVIRSRADFPRTGGVEIKKISRIVFEKLVDPKQLELAKSMSEYYFSPLGTILKSFVPPISKRSKKNNPDQESSAPRSVNLTPIQEKAALEISRLTRSSGSSSRLLIGTPGSGKTETILQAIFRLKKELPGSQFLILLPEIIQISHYRKKLSQVFPDSEIEIISSRITKSELWRAWENIRSGRTRIILSTRMGIFAPFKNLALIAIEEESDVSFKQWDMNPRYDARHVSLELSRIHQCPLILVSSAPRVETYWRFMEHKGSIIELPLFGSGQKTNAKNFGLEIVDLRKEWTSRRKKSDINISMSLASSLKDCLNKGEQAILAVSRQGMSAFAVCSQCKNVLRCPNCSRAMIYDENGEYRCLHCGKKTGIFPRCADCGNKSFRNFGVGTQKVEREIKTLFPKARIGRIDSQSIRAKGSMEKIILDFNRQQIDILIGTPMITAGWSLPTISLVGIIDADNWLSLPDFITNERFFQQFTRLYGRLNIKGASGPRKMIIQTFQPELPIFSAIKGDIIDFFKWEIEERRGLSLPPFSRLIKIIFQNMDQKKAMAYTQSGYEKIAALENAKNFTVYSPQKPLVNRVRKRYRYQIVLKTKKEWPTELVRLISQLSDNAIVDVDPISLL